MSTNSVISQTIKKVVFSELKRLSNEELEKIRNMSNEELITRFKDSVVSKTVNEIIKNNTIIDYSESFSNDESLTDDIEDEDTPIEFDYNTYQH